MRSIEHRQYTKKTGFIKGFLVAFAVMMRFISKSINTDNLIYAIGEIGTCDTGLFKNNVFWGDGVISPRYIVDYIFAAIMNLNGGSWASAAFIWIYLGVFIQSLGIANIVVRLVDRHYMLYALLLSCLFGYNGNNLAGYGVIALQSTSVGIAVAFSILAISFLFGNRNYSLAWMFAGCSSICHIHEGLYCTAVIFIFVLTEYIIEKKFLMKKHRTMFITIICLALVAIPSFTTDHMDITNKEFVYIYSIFRHPHHLVPTSWGIVAIFTSGLIHICIIALCVEICYFLKHEQLKEMLIQGILLMSAWVGAIFMAYVFTERIPIAFVSTMFLSKSFKYVTLITMIWVVRCVSWIENSQFFMMGFPLILIALFSSAIPVVQFGAFFLITAIAIMVVYSLDIKLSLPDYAPEILNNVLVLIIYIITVAGGKITDGKGVLTVTTILSVVIISDLVKKRLKKQGISRLVMGGGCCIILFISLYGNLFWSDGKKIIFNSGEKTLINSMGNDLYELVPC